MHLQVNHLYGGYGRKKVLKDISFSIQTGEVLCIIGPNGSGKSTLFKILLRLLPLQSGFLTLDNKPAAAFSAREYARYIAYIPQAHTPTFSYTVLEMVLLGRTCHLAPFRSPTEADKLIALEALTQLHIENLKDSLYTQLSGGQRQLVLIARAICQDAKLLIMDEPTANLDYANQQLILKAITSLSAKGYSILMSTHSPDQPFTVSTKVLLLKKGATVDYGSPKDILTEKNLELLFDVPMDIVSVIDRHENKRQLCLPVNF